MLHIKAGNFIYIYITQFLQRKLQAASKQCWRMVRALRSHGRCYLVVFFWWDVAVRHSYSNFLCDWPSVDHWLVNRAVRPERSSRLLSNVHLLGVVGNKLAGPLIRPSPSTIASLHDITFTSCYKFHRLQTRLRLLQNAVYQHDFKMSFKVLPFQSRISSLAVVPWRHHLVMIIWLNSQQNRFCDASKRVRPLIGVSELRSIYIYR